MSAITAFAHSLKTNKQVKEAIIVTVGRDTKIQTAQRTNQIAGFVTVPLDKKINIIQSYFCSCFLEENFRSIEDIRKELEGADIFVKKDIEIIKKHVETLNSTSSSLPEKEHALDELEFYVHQIDNAIDLDTIGGLTLVIKLMNSTDPSLVTRATYVLGSATQR